MDEDKKVGTYMLDGEIIDIDSASVEKLEDYNKKFADKLEEERNKINDILEEILV